MSLTATAIKDWRENPVKFVYDVFNVDPDEWQKDALMGIGGDENPRRRLCMKACTGPGKSAVLAWIGYHRLFCHGGKGQHPKGAALSGEGRDNLADNLWAELGKWRGMSEIMQRVFDYNQKRICAKGYESTWFLSARSYPQKATQEEVGRSLSGLHSEYPFILLDETGGMPVVVGQKATQIFTGGVQDGLIAQAGNPTSLDGLLYHTCTNEADKTLVITITADPDDPKRTPRVPIDHAREQIEQWGRDNPWVMSTILGLFPPGGLNKLLTLEEVEQSMQRSLPPETYKFAQKRLGVDVARFGDDRTVIAPRQGLQAFRYVVMRNARTNDIAARVIAAKGKWRSEWEGVDGSGGYGAGVIDSMLQGGHAPLEVQFGGKAIDPRYFNKRSEMWFEFAEWVKRGGALPKCGELKKELIAPTYTYKNGKLFLEPKEQIKDRLGYSPDIADAFAITFAQPDMPATTELDYYKMRFGKQTNRAMNEWNPLDEMDRVGSDDNDWDPTR
jgi:hypothetical protein